MAKGKKRHPIPHATPARAALSSPPDPGPPASSSPGTPPIPEGSFHPMEVDRETHAVIEAWMEKAHSGSLTPAESIQTAKTLEELKNWPIEQIGVQHLVAETRVGACAVTHLFVKIWAKEAQVYRLAKLADELTHQRTDIVRSPELLQVLTDLAQFLGVVRPSRADKLRQIALGWLRDMPELKSDKRLMESLEEAEKWTRAGLLLGSSSSTDRVFWNNRLRNPEMNWNWDDPEARSALRSLSPCLIAAPQSIQNLFQASVPGCWWDLFTSTQIEATSLPREKPQAPDPSPSPNPKSFNIIKIAALIALGGLLGAGLTAGTSALLTNNAASVPLPSTDLSANALVSRQSGESPDTRPSAHPSTSHASLSPWRLEELATIQSSYAALERLHRKLLTGTLAEVEPILRGSSSIASLHTPSHKALLRWAMIDPPKDPAVRRAVIRLFSLSPPFSETLPILEKASQEGEPHFQEMREMAHILLSARPVPLLEEQAERLRQIGH